MDIFKGRDDDEVKQHCQESNCELVVVPHNLINKFQTLNISANQSSKKFISVKFNSWYADRVSSQLSTGIAPDDVKNPLH